MANGPRFGKHLVTITVRNPRSAAEAIERAAPQITEYFGDHRWEVASTMGNPAELSDDERGSAEAGHISAPFLEVAVTAQYNRGGADAADTLREMSGDA